MPADKRRGIGQHRVVRCAPPSNVRAFPLGEPVWELDYKTRAMRRAQRIDLRFLRDIDHGAALVNGFWSRYGRNYSAQTLLTLVTALTRWAEFYRETSLPGAVGDVAAISDDRLRSFIAWNARRGVRRRATATTVTAVIECLAEAADLEEPGRGEARRQAKSELLLSCQANGRGRNTPSQALGDSEWQRLLTLARREVAATMRAYQPGQVPVSGTSLVPFLILVAAYTGANPRPLLAFSRDAWQPAPVLHDHWRVTWRKDRAKGHEEQSLVFARRVAEGLSLIDVLEFVRTWTEPLVERVPANCRGDLWLHQSRSRGARSAAWQPKIFVMKHVQPWMQRNGLKLALDRIRPSAALTLLRSGKPLTHVQSFLQHSELRTTWRYVRSAVLHPTFNRVIAATQTRIAGLVMPQPRATGATAITAAPAVQRTLLTGAWDVGTCACRDPYHSPMDGEVAGRLCRSFHACYVCPHAVWFKEHLPLEVWKLRRFEALRESDPHWSRKYGATCDIIRRDILGSFGEADRAWAEREASSLDALPVLAASGVTV